MEGVVMKLFKKKEGPFEGRNREFLRKNSYGSKVYTYWDEYITQGRLPPYEWLVKDIFRGGEHLQGRIKRDYWIDKISGACEVLDIFVFYSEEFINHLAETINKLGAKRIVEVGSGDGYLSYFLGQPLHILIQPLI